MKKAAELIVKCRWGFFALFIVLAILGAVASPFVKQNYDMAAYLPDDSDTTQALAIMKEEFGLSNNITLMLKYGEDEQKLTNFTKALGAIEGVQLVTTSDVKDGNALLLVMLNGDEYSSEAKESVARIKDLLSEYDFVLAGTAVSSDNLEHALKVEIPIIMAIAIAIIVLVLLVSSHSWFEPVIILINLLVAVLINMGSNIIFGQISYITFAVSAILQIALAMDYSIILLHGFNERRGEGKLKSEAIVESLAYNMRPISSSGLTTIAGLIALLFMSFTIGFDIGIVLAKGILISLLSVLLFMPSLIMICDKLLDKTAHKPLTFGGKRIARASVSLRAVLPAIFVVIIVGAFVLQLGNVYTFGGWDKDSGEDEIAARFGNLNQAVVLIDNDYAEDKEAQSRFADAITAALTNENGDPAIRSVNAWTTFELSPKDLGDRLGSGDLDLSGVINPLLSTEGKEPTIGDLKRLWSSVDGDIFKTEISFEAFKAMIDVVSKSEEFSWLGYIETSKLYAMFPKDGDKVTLGSLLDIDLGLFESFSGDISSIRQVISGIKAQKDTINEGISLIMSHIDREDSAPLMGETAGMSIIDTVCSVLFGEENFKVYEFETMMKECNYNIMDLEIEPQMVGNLIQKLAGVSVPDFLIKAFVLNIVKEGKVTVRDTLEFVIAQKDEQHYRELYELIGDRTVGICMLVYSFKDVFPLFGTPIEQLIASVKSNFMGANHSRIILLMDMSNDSETTFENLDFIKAQANKCFGYEDGKTNYVAGMSMTLKDISEAFSSDLTKINIVTIVSIFIIIAVLFRSLLLPFILVFVIQGAIWITMAIYSLAGIPIFFMSYIICLCIQMGATIDYGILIASNFRRNRATMNKFESIVASVHSAMPTIFSSGLILTASGFIIGFVSSVMPIYSIGRLLGLGTIISIFMILFLLPSLLYLLDKPISWLTFDKVKTVNNPKPILVGNEDENSVGNEANEKPLSTENENGNENENSPTSDENENDSEKPLSDEKDNGKDNEKDNEKTISNEKIQRKKKRK